MSIDREKLLEWLHGAVDNLVPRQGSIEQVQEIYGMGLHDLNEEQKMVWFCLFVADAIHTAYDCSADNLNIRKDLRPANLSHERYKIEKIEDDEQDNEGEEWKEKLK